MQLIFILCAVLVAASAAPSDRQPINILAQTDERLSDGSSHWSYSGSDGTTRIESSYQKSLGGTESGNANQGSVIWTSPEGKQFVLSWVADETGFHAVGDHLPTPPPIPEEIAKMLATLSPADDYSYDYLGF